MAVIILVLAGVFSLAAWQGFYTAFSKAEKRDAYRDNSILFYGKGCEHCNTVEKFIVKNKIQEKFNFIELEV